MLLSYTENRISRSFPDILIIGIYWAWIRSPGRIISSPLYGYYLLLPSQGHCEACTLMMPLCRWGKWGADGLIQLPEISHLDHGRAENTMQVYSASEPCPFPQMPVPWKSVSWLWQHIGISCFLPGLCHCRLWFNYLISLGFILGLEILLCP